LKRKYYNFYFAKERKIKMITFYIGAIANDGTGDAFCNFAQQINLLYLHTRKQIKYKGRFGIR
jgi:hypothetical protein